MHQAVEPVAPILRMMERLVFECMLCVICIRIYKRSDILVLINVVERCYLSIVTYQNRE